MVRVHPWVNSTWSLLYLCLHHLNSCILQITVWLSSISLHAYADVSFESKSDVSLHILLCYIVSQQMLLMKLWIVPFLLMVFCPITYFPNGLTTLVHALLILLLKFRIVLCLHNKIKISIYLKHLLFFSPSLGSVVPKLTGDNNCGRPEI